MDGAVTLDIAKTEQSSLARQLSQLQHQQKSFADTEVDYATTVNRALTILDHCGSAYEQAKSQERRLLNQSWFERILVNYEDDAAFIETADKTDTLEILSTAQVGEPRPGEGDLTLRTYSTVKGSMVASLVGLLHSYSKLLPAGEKVKALYEMARKQPKSSVESDIPDGLSKPLPVRLRRLTELEIATICQLYEDGSTVYEIADEVGISRQRVSTVLKRAGIEMRRVSPTRSQIDEAARLYEAGQSLAQIGDKLKFDDGTIWRHLKARGVQMRDTHGREA